MAKNKPHYFGATDTFIRDSKVIQCSGGSPNCFQRTSNGYIQTHIGQTMCLMCMKHYDLLGTLKRIPNLDSRQKKLYNKNKLA